LPAATVQVRAARVDSMVMTDIEVLLSVDAGRIPEGTTAFFVRDRDRTLRRWWATISIAVMGAAVACGFVGAGYTWVAVLLLIGGVFAVMATPTLSDETYPDVTRQVLVVTPQAILMRDGQGLRTWTFEDLADASAWRYADRVDLLLVRRDGGRVFIDCQNFHRGDRLPDVIAQRLSARSDSRQERLAISAL
jgi:hypothetical protein